MLGSSGPRSCVFHLSLTAKLSCPALSVTLLCDFNNFGSQYVDPWNHQFLDLQTHNYRSEGVKRLLASVPAKPVSSRASSTSDLSPSQRP